MKRLSLLNVTRLARREMSVARHKKLQLLNGVLVDDPNSPCRILRYNRCRRSYGF
jgi:hypothetical protein